MTSRVAPRSSLIVFLLSISWSGVWGLLFFDSRFSELLDSLVARLIVMGAPLLVGTGWLLSARARRRSEASEPTNPVADLALIDDLNRAANIGENRDQLLARLAEGSHVAFSSSGAYVYLLDDAQEYLVLLSDPSSLLNKTGITLSARFGRPRIRVADSTWYAKALHATLPIVTSDFDDIVAMAAEFEGSDSYKTILPTMVRTQRIASVMTAPILSADRVLGIVDISRSWPFTSVEAQRFHVLCEEVAVVVTRIDMEERLAKSEGLHRALTELTPGLIYVVDGSLHVVHVNSAAARFVGRSPDDLRGERVGELFGPAGNLFEERLSRVSTTGQPLSFEDCLPRGEAEMWLQTSLVPLAEVTPGFVMGVSQDVTDSKHAELMLRGHAEEEERLATHDGLTGLENRRAFSAALDRALAFARRGTSSSVLFMDIDCFKQCNDLRGHAFGDEVLISVADLLKRQVREVDLVARVGGDEFAALLTDSTAAEASVVAERMKASVKALGDDVGIPIGLSVGLMSVKADATIDDVLSIADQRMYEDKAAGRSAQDASKKT